jgi:hypothetical protein
MVDLLERIGPYLGLAAFLGLAILAFLIFQQAREVRRLREWAGRAPERAGEAAEASAAAAEARGETIEPEEEPPRESGAVGRWWDRVRERAGAAYAELDRRMPVDPRYLLAVLAAGVVAAVVLTSGFGLFGGDEGGGKGGGKRGGGQEQKPEKVEVAVLNGTAIEEGPATIDPVEGLAARVAAEVVRPAGFKVATEETASSGFEQTTVMFEEGAEADAEELADAVSQQLGDTPTTAMIDEVRQLADGAELALVIGADDDEF